MTAAAMAAATAVEPTAATTKAAACSTTAESAACRRCTATRPCSASVAANSGATVSRTSSAGIPATATYKSSASVTVAAAAITVPATTVPATSVPRAGAQEHATVEPLRAIITIRSAGIRVIGIIAPITYRRAVIHRGGYNSRSNSDTHCHLSVCRYRERQGQKHRKKNQA